MRSTSSTSTGPSRATTSSTAGRIAVAAALLFAGTTLLAAPAGSETLAVTTTTDGGPGSLRAAVDAANATSAPGSIVLQAGAEYVLSACGSDGLTNSGGPLTIVGNGATIRQSCSSERVLRNTSSSMLTIENLTLSGGDAPTDGGAILSNAGPVTITGSTLSGNRSAGFGGAVFVDGGTTVRIHGSAIRDNQSFDYGGGVGVRGELHMTDSVVESNVVSADNAYGGGIFVDPTGAAPARITGSTVRGNLADGADGLGGGIYVAGDSLALDTSTVADNSAGGDGGGIYAYYDTTITRSTVSGNRTAGRGGGIFSYDPSLELRNSTVVDNTAAASGGGVFGEGFDMTLTFATFGSNTAPSGAHIDLGGGALSTFGSVLADALGGSACSQLAADSRGHNYEQGADTCGLRAATDVVNGANAALGNLADNGGPTLTELPGATSPLLDAIPAGHASCTGADQRGVARPQSGSCDIGAVERSDTDSATGPVAPEAPLAFTG